MAAIYGSVSSTTRPDIRRTVAFGFPGEVLEVGIRQADLDHSPSPNKTYGLFWKGDGQILGNYVSRMEGWKLQAEEDRIKRQEEAQQMFKKQYEEACENAKCMMEKQYEAAFEDARHTLKNQFQEAFDHARSALEKQYQEAFDHSQQTIKKHAEEARQKMKDSYEQETSELLQGFQRQRKEELECKVCFSERRSRILFPCMHFRLCETCAARVDGPCPWCRATVEHTYQVFE